MDDSVWFGIALALVMIFLMFLPNFIFKPPANYEEIRDQYIRDMIKLSEEELEKEEKLKKHSKGSFKKSE
jgi:F0F1-type ATP synthase membrane subunit b/b'